MLVAGILDASASTMSRAATPARTRPTLPSSRRSGRTRAVFTAFGMTKRPGSASPTIPASAPSSTRRPRRSALSPRPGTTTSAPSRSKTTEEENLDGIRQSVAAARAAGKEVLLDCEHFFDGYKANPDYALACAKAAYDEGARWIVLCDTNGGTMPEEVGRSSLRSPRSSPATISAFMPITTPSRRSPIRLPRSVPAPATSRARSTASASAAATPT